MVTLVLMPGDGALLWLVASAVFGGGLWLRGVVVFGIRFCGEVEVLDLVSGLRLEA